MSKNVLSRHVEEIKKSQNLNNSLKDYQLSFHKIWFKSINIQ